MEPLGLVDPGGGLGPLPLGAPADISPFGRGTSSRPADSETSPSRPLPANPEPFP